MGERFEALLTATLTHPAALAVKRPMRDAWWRVRGLSIADARCQPSFDRILFICKGNICRSPFAEHLAARLLAASGRPEVRCVSAGLVVSAEHRSPDAAVVAARTFGIASRDIAPVSSEPWWIEHDLMVVTEAAHLIALRQRHPSASAIVALLPLYGDERSVRRGYARYNIADPYGKSPDRFAECYAQIAQGVTDLVATIGRQTSRCLHAGRMSPIVAHDCQRPDGTVESPGESWGIISGRVARGGALALRRPRHEVRE